MFTPLQWAMRINFVITLLIILLLTACEKQKGQSSAIGTAQVSMQRTGWLKSSELYEASGMQASFSREGDFFVHNDEGEPVIYAIDENGTDLGMVILVPAKNKDWEDITSVPVDNGRWMVAGDIGDNRAKRKYIKLYFFEEPSPGKNDRYAGRQDLQHTLVLTYPDGPRDCESMAYDPVDKQILLLSKRDKPPRLYAVDIETALTQMQAELTFLGPTSKLRPPTLSDRARFGGRTDFISQPTGLDISSDGTRAAIITYRSLYLYHREPGEDWISALQKKPTEVVGPPAVQNEAIAFSADGKAIFITTEKKPTPLYRFEWSDEPVRD